MNKKNLVYTIALFVAVTGITGVSLASAYQGDSEKKGSNFDPERHEQMQNAIESGDYEAWSELMGDRPVTETITEENFSKFMEMHELMRAGDKEGAKAVADELGLPERKGEGFGHRRANKGQFKQMFKDGLRDVNGDGTCTIKENAPSADTAAEG